MTWTALFRWVGELC